MEYREMELWEVDKIEQINAKNEIRNAWRKVNGELQLVEINWTDYDLPNGLAWHKARFQQTIQNGGKAYGCFENNMLIGYGTINAELFGAHSKYALLDQLFISEEYRGKGIGRKLLSLCKEHARKQGASKLYIAAGSAENTIAFYKSQGFVNAVEINAELAAEDENDMQMEVQISE